MFKLNYVNHGPIASYFSINVMLCNVMLCYVMLLKMKLE